ncbi:hypothetical protein E2542_SST21364 [Spatholobus suberectus]|nr:hypothetical protein E2542_SST21364 [Spatholobus suberectus]
MLDLGSAGLTDTMSHMQSSFQKPGIIPIHSVGWNSQSRLFTQSLAIGVKHINSHNKWKRTLVSCVKTIEVIDATNFFESLSKRTSGGKTFANYYVAQWV